MLQHRILRILGIAAAWAFGHASAWGVELSMRDTTLHFPDTLRIALLVDSISRSDSLLSYQFVLTFDSAVLRGVGADAQGTLSEPFGDPFTSGGTYHGELRVAAAGIETIYGRGPLVNLLLSAVSDRDGVSAVHLDAVLFNEGTPAATYADPLSMITIQSLGVHERPRIPSVGRLSLSPNPAHGFVVVTFPRVSPTRWLRVWNITGQVVYSSPVVSGSSVVLLYGLASGSYYVTVDECPNWSTGLILVR